MSLTDRSSIRPLWSSVVIATLVSSFAPNASSQSGPLSYNFSEPTSITMQGGVFAETQVVINGSQCASDTAPDEGPLFLTSSCELGITGGTCALGSFPPLLASASCPGSGSSGSSLSDAAAQSSLTGESAVAGADSDSLTVNGGLVGVVGGEAHYHGHPCGGGGSSGGAGDGTARANLQSITDREIVIPFIVDQTASAKGIANLFLLWDPSSSASPSVDADVWITWGVSNSNVDGIAFLDATGAVNVPITGEISAGMHQLTVHVHYDFNVDVRADCNDLSNSAGGPVVFGWDVNIDVKAKP